MSRLGYVADVLKEFGDEIGMDGLALDDTDRLSLVFDGLLVTLAYTSEPLELIWIYVDLGEVPAEGVKVLQHLLKLGFECWAQNVMTIGLDDEGRNAVGYSSIPVTLLDKTVLKETLSRLLEVTFMIKEELAQVAFDELQHDNTTHELQLPPSALTERCDYRTRPPLANDPRPQMSNGQAQTTTASETASAAARCGPASLRRQGQTTRKVSPHTR